MLTRIKVDGFKNLVGVDVRFGPFTCIAGANGVGKSNLFDAIRFLSALSNWSLLEAALAVRDDSGRNTDVRGLFHHVGNRFNEKMSFEAEMIVPPTATDDLGQPAKATTTFLRYTLELRLRNNARDGMTPNPLEILKEELVHIQKGEASQHILFDHDAKNWRNSVITGRRSGIAFISTAYSDSSEPKRIIKLHQDGGGKGRAYERAAETLPRTVLSSATAAESPTALCARREMQSWRLLQLEPAALRHPDDFSAQPHLTSNGNHLAATLYRLASQQGEEKVYCQVANRLSELIGDVKGIRVDRDEKREQLTLHMTGADATEHPARALSDGTLRFLALAVLELDSEAPGVLCMEEPENGIHPDRVPAILRLLQEIATDTEEPVDETNPLRQVIVNTHSPSVVMAVPDDSVLLAKQVPDSQGGEKFSRVTFSSLPGNWRLKTQDQVTPVNKGDLLAYLNPGGSIKQEASLNSNNGSVKPRTYRRRVIDHPEFQFLIPQ